MTEHVMTFTAHIKPRCFDTTEDWREWCAFRGRPKSPCVDCTPSYRNKMRDKLRCERPEVIFTVDDETGEFEGISADEAKFARILMGLSLGSHAQIVGRTVEDTPAWEKLLSHIRRRAHKDVRHAIDIWLRRYERAKK